MAAKHALLILIVLLGFEQYLQAGTSMYARHISAKDRMMSVIRPRIYQNREMKHKNSQYVSKSRLQSPNRSLPCCKDESGGSICKNLKRTDPKLFNQNFFSGPSNSTHCFDRMSPAYCSRFETGDDAWNNRRWSCDTSHFRLGFRVCRATCGFCGFDWLNAPEPLKCL
ncbi:unnamed protein product [Caenorhabditis bovis]|uniref:ShKT domain-containing protein n=1 Tax=Caenorhabditis bovis TaxID=2654633 RepID=A0A8S1FED5_9PELO|nr:unnamed protein product [Caenorhabditis bovis]